MEVGAFPLHASPMTDEEMPEVPEAEESAGGVSDRDRARELGELLWLARTTFLSASSDFHWRPGRTSQASLDNDALTAFDTAPNGKDGIFSGSTLIHEVVATYLEIGAGHLAGMGLLFYSGEVFFPPKPLARSVIENCARAQWVLGKTRDKAEARLARAYLEEFYSSMVAKRTAGHLGEKADPVHQAARARWKEVRARMIAAFPDATPTTIDAGELGGEKQPGVEECVKWFYELLRDHAGGTLDDKQAEGLYDFLSSGTHPTLYQARQLREYVDHGDHAGTRLVMDIGFLERLAGAVLVAYYQVLASTFSYFGADPSPVEAFGDAIAAALPGTLAPSTT